MASAIGYHLDRDFAKGINYIDFIYLLLDTIYNDYNAIYLIFVPSNDCPSPGRLAPQKSLFKKSIIIYYEQQSYFPRQQLSGL